MKDTDRLLIGTRWNRVGHNHYQTEGIIDSVSSRGVRLKVRGETNRHNASYIRAVWAELNFSWRPADAKTEKAWHLWRLADHIEYLDEKDAQTKAGQDAEMKQTIAAIQTPIEREIELPQINGAVTMETPEVAVKECHGAWHRNKDGKYDLVPLSSFDIATRGPNRGQLAAVCRDCNRKNKLSPSHKSKATTRVQKLEPAPAPVVITPKVETAEGTYYRWKVTVIQTVEHVVQGKDLLDVAAQAETLGRVIKVEQL